MHNQDNNTINSFVAGAAGAMLGAAAGAAAIALVDEKNRKAIIKNGSHILRKAKKEVAQLLQVSEMEKDEPAKRKIQHTLDDLDAETPKAL